jgi:hypothetical protein
MLNDVSINNSIIAPNNRAGIKLAKLPELGMKNIANAEIIEPSKMKGILRPRRVQVLSLESPSIG